MGFARHYPGAMEDSSPVRIALLEVDSGDTGVQVRLQLRDRTTAGVGHGRDRLRAAANATLDAVSPLLPPAVELRLETIRLLPAVEEAPFDLVVVVVTAAVAGTDLCHSGSALVQGSAEHATAAAVLDALNRRLEILGI